MASTSKGVILNKSRIRKQLRGFQDRGIINYFSVEINTHMHDIFGMIWNESVSDLKYIIMTYVMI